MIPHAPAFGPLDEVLGRLLETWNHRYHFEMHREERLLLLSKPPDNGVGAKELPNGRILVVYQLSSDAAEEHCSVDRAVRLIDSLMARENVASVLLDPDRSP
jgi:hypothetical protein